MNVKTFSTAEQLWAKVWAVFLGNILMMKVCFKTITSTRITKEGLQRSKGNKKKMNEDLLKLANI